MSKYYYHGVDDLSTMLSIIKSQEIKSKRLLGDDVEYGFNGLDYISVCNKLPKEEYKKYYMNTYENYIKHNFCFIISDEIETIKTEFLDITLHALKEIHEHVVAHPDIRYSDMIDEYQIKDSIPFKYIIGIGLPMKYIGKLLNLYPSLSYSVHEFCLLIQDLNLDIVNTDEEDFIEKYEEKKNSNVYNKEKEYVRIMKYE